MLLFKNRSFRISSYFEDSITTDLDIRFLKMMSSKRALTLTHNKTKEHIDGRIHMCELYLSSVCCFGLLNHASATWFFYLYICVRCFGLLNHASSTRFFYLYICASYDASIVLIQASRVHILRFTDLPKLSNVG